MSASERDRLLGGYLDRLGLSDADIAAVRRHDRAALAGLVVAHVAAIPFENLRVMRGEVIRTDALGAVRRIVDGRAGGVCYELNGALAWLLTELGVATRLWAARVRQDDPGEPGRSRAPDDTGPVAGATESPSERGVRFGIPAGHGFVEVRQRGVLLDVGFGGEGIIGDMVHEGDLVTSPTGRVYRAERAVESLESFAEGAAWQSSSPDSRFTGSLIASVTAPSETRTLFGSFEDPAAPTEASIPLRYTSIVTGRDGQRDVRALSYAQAQQFAIESLALGDPLPQWVARA